MRMSSSCTSSYCCQAAKQCGERREWNGTPVVGEQQGKGIHSSSMLTYTEQHERLLLQRTGESENCSREIAKLREEGRDHCSTPVSICQYHARARQETRLEDAPEITLCRVLASSGANSSSWFRLARSMCSTGSPILV